MSYCRIQRADNFLDVTAGFMTPPLIYHFGCAVRIVSKIHSSNLGLIDFPAEPDEVGIDRDTRIEPHRARQQLYSERQIVQR